jgi:hypothetical protein
MAHTGKFKLDGKEADIVNVSYHLDRGINEKGKPSTLVRNFQITITIASDDKLKNAAIDWLKEGNGAKKGKKGEVIIHDEEGKEFKKIEFENAFIINYNENFSYGMSDNVQETFTITAEKVKIGTADFDFKWPVA